MVQNCLKETKSAKGGIIWNFREENSFFKQGGSGNNWALGYDNFGQQEAEIVNNIIRGSLERTDYFGGFQVLQSLAGGTGSGLGTHLVESLRDENPKKTIVNFSVWPYITGEVVLQNYNVLLTLQGLLNDSSAVVTVFNDEVLTICRELLKIKRPAYSTLNQVIAR